MKHRRLFTGIMIALIAVGGATVFTETTNSESMVVHADSSNYAPLLSGDSGLGPAKGLDYY